MTCIFAVLYVIINIYKTLISYPSRRRELEGMAKYDKKKEKKKKKWVKMKKTGKKRGGGLSRL